MKTGILKKFSVVLLSPRNLYKKGNLAQFGQQRAYSQMLTATISSSDVIKIGIILWAPVLQGKQILTFWHKSYSRLYARSGIYQTTTEQPSLKPYTETCIKPLK